MVSGGTGGGGATVVGASVTGAAVVVGACVVVVAAVVAGARVVVGAAVVDDAAVVAGVESGTLTVLSSVGDEPSSRTTRAIPVPTSAARATPPAIHHGVRFRRGGGVSRNAVGAGVAAGLRRGGGTHRWAVRAFAGDPPGGAGDAATTADPPTATPEVGGANTGGVAGGTVGGPAAVTGGSNAVVVEPAAVPFEAGPPATRATLIGNGR